MTEVSGLKKTEESLSKICPPDTDAIVSLFVIDKKKDEWLWYHKFYRILKLFGNQNLMSKFNNNFLYHIALKPFTDFKHIAQ